MRYVSCASESHNERMFCECIEQELSDLGITFERQELGNEVLTDGWNILAKMPGEENKQPFLFVFHLDTVAPSNQVEAYIENGCIKSRGKSVLGADGKLAIAVVMEAIRQIRREGAQTRPVEMLFTVCQELGLCGAKYADYSHIESEEAIVIDHYVTGEVLLHTPARFYVNVELIGHAAHVIRDEELGINALTTAAEIIHQLPAGRVDENLNINIFDLVSLSSSNAVPGHARFDIEIRCFGEARLKRTRDLIRTVVEETAKKRGCCCHIHEELDVPETDFSRNRDMLKRLEDIYHRSGIPMTFARSFGVLDATCTEHIGIRTVPIGFNIYHSHSAKEYVIINEMEKMLELAKNLILFF